MTTKTNLDYLNVLSLYLPKKLQDILNMKTSKELLDYVQNLDRQTKLNYWYKFSKVINPTKLQEGLYLLFSTNPLVYLKWFWKGDEKEINNYLNCLTKGGWDLWLSQI